MIRSAGFDTVEEKARFRMRIPGASIPHVVHHASGSVLAPAESAPRTRS
jgi:hypothetical protein